MFGWLANLLIKTPVQGTCSCCEGKKKQLQKMQQVILGEEVDENLFSNEETANNCGCSHSNGEAHQCCKGKKHYSSSHYHATNHFEESDKA